MARGWDVKIISPSKGYTYPAKIVSPSEFGNKNQMSLTRMSVSGYFLYPEVFDLCQRGPWFFAVLSIIWWSYRFSNLLQSTKRFSLSLLIGPFNMFAEGTPMLLLWLIIVLVFFGLVLSSFFIFFENGLVLYRYTYFFMWLVIVRHFLYTTCTKSLKWSVGKL